MIERTQADAVLQQNEEVVSAWKDYQETGLHATLDELDAWLAIWGTHQMPPVRKPHVLDQSDTALLGLRGTGQGIFEANVGRVISELRDEWE